MQDIPQSLCYNDIIHDVLRAQTYKKDHHIKAYQLTRHVPGGGTEIPFDFQSYNDVEQRSIGEHLLLSSHAESMLLTRLRIPGGYFHRCPDNMQMDQINYWLLNSRQSLCIRTINSNHVRAVFGPRFKPDLDDHYVIPRFALAAEAHIGQENGQLVWCGFNKDERITKLSTFYSNLTAEYDGIFSRVGVVLINSEVGSSALHIRPIIHNRRYYRWVDFYAGCSGCTSLRHTQELRDGVVEAAVEKALQAAQVGVHRLFETTQEKVEKPAEDLKKFVDASAVLSARVMDGLLEDYQTKQLTTKYQVAEDILLACKNLPVFKQHVVGVEVGRYLGLFDADEARLDDILE